MNNPANQYQSQFPLNKAKADEIHVKDPLDKTAQFKGGEFVGSL